MKASITVLVVTSVFLGSACAGSPRAADTTIESTTTAGAPRTDTSSQPSGSPSADGDVIVHTVAGADARPSARQAIVDRGALGCLREAHGDYDPATIQARLVEAASQLSGDSGLLAGDIPGWVGDLRAAATAFGATEVLVGTGTADRRAWLLKVAQDENPQINVANGSLVAIELTAVHLADGRVVWAQLGDFIASVACPPR